jgi:hypothetical protein
MKIFDQKSTNIEILGLNLARCRLIDKELIDKELIETPIDRQAKK